MAGLKKKTAEYGSWDAHITMSVLTEKTNRIGTLKVQGDVVYWTEQRPDEGGRSGLMSWSQEHGLVDCFNAPFSARSRVHEYGGGDFCLGGDKIYFVNASDQQIYSCLPQEAPLKLTDFDDFRFADLQYDPLGPRLFAVAEKHDLVDDGDTHSLPKNMLVVVPLKGKEAGQIVVLDETHDFYGSPRLSADHKTLAWLDWDLPDMPWESSRLMMADVGGGEFIPQIIAGGFDQTRNDTSSAFGPVWDRSGALYYVDDQSGYGQLYCWSKGVVSLVLHQDEMADGLRPLWVFGMESLAVSKTGAVYLSSYGQGKHVLQSIQAQEIGQIKSSARSVEMLQMFGEQLVGIVTTDYSPASVMLIEPEGGELSMIRPSARAEIIKGDISVGQLKEFMGPNGPVYGLYYPPIHSKLMGPPDALPPAIISIHGGPTGMADRGLKFKTQYWTNRGYGVFDIDYSGSSGYGKAYRERLNGQWGRADVADIIAGARTLIEEGLVDRDKLIVMGGSAGGYSALMALVESDLFQCASCSYPVTDLAQLLEITHKFEAGYIYALTGTTVDTAKEQLKDVSVLSHLDKIDAPVVFFQGLEDKVVPPAQPRAVYEALRAKGVVSELYEFEEEGHGFRGGKTIEMVLKKEAAFFNSVFNRF